MLRLWFSVEESFTSVSYTKDELIDDIYAVLNEWGYRVTEETDNQVAFVRDERIVTDRTPLLYRKDSKGYAGYSHSGNIEFSQTNEAFSLKLNYTVTYWGELIFSAFVIFMCCSAGGILPFILFPSITILASIDRHYSIRKKSVEMLSDIISI